MKKAIAAMFIAAAATTGLAAPASAAVSVTYTVEADTPDVLIAYSPGQWQRYTLSYSNLAGRYALGINTRPERAENMFIAIKGSTSQHCRIRVQGAVIAVDNSPIQAVCWARSA
ncbi:hypothetical protein GCM10010528_04430 [Gordonia defluvii]|uniref:Uncharacterized protein n=1 Tax=Gordonia defluvii TaxID=283718 RepID=A0ABP6KWL0_9ACTN